VSQLGTPYPKHRCRQRFDYGGSLWCVRQTGLREEDVSGRQSRVVGNSGGFEPPKSPAGLDLTVDFGGDEGPQAQP
jgi:hypothetical protein